ncbi:MAG: hypothetical protein RL693_2184, partial [Verrucomicrobiota bacterium]
KALSQGYIKLLTFHKTGETELANLRLVNADAEIEFLEDCNWPITTEVLALKTIPETPPNVKKGEHRKMKLTLQFYETERGWKATKQL